MEVRVISMNYICFMVRVTPSVPKATAQIRGKALLVKRGTCTLNGVSSDRSHVVDSALVSETGKKGVRGLGCMMVHFR